MLRSVLINATAALLLLGPACTGDGRAIADGTCTGRWSDVAPAEIAAALAPTDDQLRVGTTAGSYSRDVALPVPRFRGLEPRLALRYDSARHDGRFGVGWTLAGVPHIERAVGDRVYLVTSPAAQELLPDAELVPGCTALGGTHCTRRQTFARIVQAGDGWTVTATDGTVSTFSPGAADVWVLSRVSDPSGRQVDLEHVCDAAGCAPRVITYNNARIDLAYDAGRLSAIDVTAAGVPVRAIRLEYVSSADTGRALLAAITDLGRDPGAAPLLAPMRFEYRGDLLTGVDNGRGAREDVIYWPASRFGAELPFELPLVRAVTTSDGRGASWTTVRDYLGAAWNPGARRFLGFAAVTEHLPVDPRNLAYLDRATRYSVDPASAGVVLSTTEAQTDACGTSASTTLRQVEHEHAVRPDGAVLRIATTTTSHGLDGSTARRRVEWEHDEFGHVRVERDLGDDAIADDGRVRIVDRAPNRELHLTHLPARVETTDIHGVRLEETFSFYDDAADWSAPPRFGRLTRTGQNTGAGELLGPTAVVDGHGNTVAIYRTELDAVHPQATREYDAAFHEYVTVAVDHARPGIEQRTVTAWDLACGAPSSRTTPGGVTTSFTHDALCRPVEERNLQTGRVVRREHHPDRVHEELVTAEGIQWTDHHLDGLGREWKTVSSAPGAPIVVEREFSPAGLVVRESAPRHEGADAATTEIAHDALGRVVRVTHPDGASRTMVHTARGVETIDEVGHRRRRHREGDDLVDEELSGDTWLVTRRRHDALGRLTAVVDPAGQTVTTYERDLLGRITRTVDADRGVTTYQHHVHDAAWAVTRVDAAGRRTTTTLDWLGRKGVELREPDGDGTSYDASWLYEDEGTPPNEIGHLRATSFGSGWRRHFYDAAGNRTRTETTLLHRGRGYRFVTERGFDAAGRLRWVRFPDGDMLGRPDRPMTYDAAGRVTSADAPDRALVTRVEYTAAGHPSRLELGNGAVTERTYAPARGWLTGLVTTQHGVDVQRLTVERDAEGIIRAVESQPRYERWSRHERWRYEIDDLHRLTEAVNLTDGAYSQSFRYDAVGNLVSNSLVGTYRYGTGDGRLPHAVTAVEQDGAIAELGYDAAGNLVTGSPASSFERQILYGADGRPRAIRKWSNLEGGGFSRADTFYDGEGARVVKIVEGGRVTFYVGDGFEIEAGESEDGELVDIAVSKQIELAGLPVAQRTSHQGWWCDTAGTGDTGCLGPIETTWLHVDHLGSVQARTSDDAEALGESEHAGGRLKYRPYGLPLVPGQTGHTYAGAEQDETGLVYLGARYYDPYLARFVSPDPTHTGPGIGLNRYAYADGNPVSYVDPTGYAAARPPGDGAPEEDGGGDEPLPPVGPGDGPGIDPAPPGDDMGGGPEAPVYGPELPPVYGPELPPIDGPEPPLTVVVSDGFGPPQPAIGASTPITIGGDGLGAEDAAAIGVVFAGAVVVAGAALACSAGACPAIAAGATALFYRIGPSRSADLLDFSMGVVVPTGKQPKDPKRAAVAVARGVDPASPSAPERVPVAEPGPTPAPPVPTGTPTPRSSWSGGGGW